MNAGNALAPSASRRESGISPLYTATKSLYLETRSILSGYPAGYKAMMSVVGWLRPIQDEVRVTRDSDIVIDGFPRSANTFFVSHFAMAQKRPLKIARHLHDAYQIVYAEQHDIPAVVLVREPLPAVSSAKLRNPEFRTASLLRNYRRFYEIVLAHHRRAIISLFADSTGNADSVIARVNRAYGVSFDLLGKDHAGDVLKSVVAADKRALGDGSKDPTRLAVPSAEKDEEKRRVMDGILVAHPHLLAQCEAVYARMAALYQAQVGVPR